ncbi:MAG: phosphoglycerate dehydrogenase [Candidatus Poseidoniia archaeon]|jgi:D-3-phosphoglycerate dehydrogenase|nr:phosphoglycerate dehydrogenase [Candidatus Poseidoniia archaeon]MDP6658151.1 phosphoglycerate dehydrogenase [Candidatus Poseidoniia archaeon]MDP6846508.1 phosphoglycerate dehydrogenase [Candidatus Poseidoniia archaeon]|tara:strand:- start:2311 stop:3888 length:1578 start_codon:yes stop_codon:yes gene_type:complete
MAEWRILVADEVAPEGVELLRSAAQVSVHAGLSEAELRAALPGCHALVVRSATKVTARALEAADSLVVIGRAGIGVDSIDVAAATERGIAVMNTPESGAVTTAEHTLAMIMALARRIPLGDRLLREGDWAKPRLVGIELRGKTLGVVGLGRIGRVVADRALGLKMRVLAHDPFLKEPPEGVQLVSFERCLAESDIVTLHAPLVAKTRHLMNAAAFAQMQPGARLVNCARGGLVDEAALQAALESGHLAGAALDVYDREPLDEAHPLLGLDNVILTPHLGASTREAKVAVVTDLAQQILTCLETGLVLNGINVPHVPAGEAQFLAPFLKLAERLGALLVQAFPGSLTALKVTTQGDLAQAGQRPVQVAALAGALRPLAEGAVTQVNAEKLAGEMDVALSGGQDRLKRDFVNLLRIEAEIDGGTHFASGTLIGRRHLRMVELDAFLLDAIPEGELLLTWHQDRPGMLGRIGTLLGEHGVNISRLQLGRHDGGALAIYNLDAPLNEGVRNALAAVDGIGRIRTVSLPD